jgi:hypothetical protein
MEKSLFYYLLIAFSIGCSLRLVPIILNFPIPIGYDTVNYYLPNLYHFENNWIDLVVSFPVYITIVYIFSYIFAIDVYYSFLGSNVVLYGLFSITVFLLSKTILKQTLNRSLIFALFVIFQLSTLRISWDLFRNLFSLIFFNLFLLLIYYFRQKSILNNRISLLPLFIISIVTIFSDRLIGILLISVSLIHSVLYRQKYIFILNLFFVFSFLYYFLTFDRTTFVSSNLNVMNILLNPLHGKNTFSQFDVSILFLALYGVLLPFFIRGFIFTKFKGGLLLIKLPLMISLSFSFSWLVIPNYAFLVPERWLLISGIYISLISIYGFCLLVDSFIKHHEKLRKGIVILFLSIFVIYGFMFVIMPSGIVFSLPSFFQQNIGFIFPYSMNFNSIKITDSADLLKSIDWLNTSTQNNSIIIGSKHWRGWFYLFLQPSHQYYFTEDFIDLNDTNLDNKKIASFYSSLDKKFSYLCNNTNKKMNLPLYFIDLKSHYNSSLSANLLSPVDYKTTSFVIYDLNSRFCKS